LAPQRAPARRAGGGGQWGRYELPLGPLAPGETLLTFACRGPAIVANDVLHNDDPRALGLAVGSWGSRTSRPRDTFAGDDVDGKVDQGSAYVFVKAAAGWSEPFIEQARLIASDGAANDVFGSVAVSGDTIVVGANGCPNANVCNTQPVSAHDPSGLGNRPCAVSPSRCCMVVGQNDAQRLAVAMRRMKRAGAACLNWVRAFHSGDRAYWGFRVSRS
jgi:hypothetical protein